MPALYAVFYVHNRHTVYDPRTREKETTNIDDLSSEAYSYDGRRRRG